MANICDNKFLIYCDDSGIIQQIVQKLDKLFTDSLDGEVSFNTENTIEGYFDSRWDFPMHLFENFFDEFTNDSLYMRCLSEEYGCDLVSMNIYSDNSWQEPQYFDL